LEDAREQEQEWRHVRLSNGHLVRTAPTGPHEWRFRYGFRPLAVASQTPATEKAVVAALAALKGKTVEPPNHIPYAAALSESLEDTKAGKFGSLRALREELRKDPGLKGARVRDLRNVRVAVLLKTLLRLYRPEFDDLPEHKRTALMEQAASHLNEFLDTLRKLMEFLEVGDSTAGIPKTKLKKTQEQLLAAQLCDIAGLSHREIGAALSIELSVTDKRRGGHQKAKERVREGRKILREAFGGEDGYRRYIEQEKNEASRRSLLTTEEKFAEDFGEESGIPADSMRVIMTGDIDAAKAEVAKLAPEKANEAVSARAVWEHWHVPDDPDSPLILRDHKP
jgi:hypothetical protein